MDSYTISYDTTFYTESFYTNILVLICSLLIWALNSKNKIAWIILSISLIIPPLIRPNGIYIYFMLFYLLLYFTFNRFPFKRYLTLLAPFILLNILWAGYNFHTTGYFTVGSLTRITRYYSSNKKEISTNNLQTPAKNNSVLKNLIKTKGKVIKIQFTNISISKWQFYYHDIPTRYSNLYTEDLIHDTNVLKRWCTNDYLMPLRESGRILMFKDFYYKGNVYKDVMKNFDNNHKSANLWVMLYHVYFYIHEKIFWNIAWLFMFFIILITTSLILIKEKLRNKDAFLINSLCLIHFLSVIVISAHDNPLRRYVHVTEFIYYIVPVLFIPFIIKYFNKNKSIKTVIE